MSKYLTDGHGTLVEFNDFPSVKFKEREVAPPGFDGGAANNITTMRNEKLTTQAPQKLYTMTEFTMSVLYDPVVITDIKNMINVNQEIVVTHSDGSSWTFWGFLQKFIPGTNKKGEAPMATITVTPTNYDVDEEETEAVFTDAP